MSIIAYVIVQRDFRDGSKDVIAEPIDSQSLAINRMLEPRETVLGLVPAAQGA